METGEALCKHTKLNQSYFKQNFANGMYESKNVQGKIVYLLLKNKSRIPVLKVQEIEFLKFLINYFLKLDVL
jgi:hypothetical protein